MSDYINEGTAIILRSTLSVAVLFIISKAIGTRQISQLTFYDYIVGISIGSIAASLALDKDITFWHPLLAMIVYALFSYCISLITSKSIIARRFFTGKPDIIIYKGSFIEKNINKNHLDINEVISECRLAGYFNIADIEYAIMETTGKISFLPKSSARPPNSCDLNLSPKPSELVANIIIDGKIMSENLKAMGKNEQWLKNELQKQKIDKISEILLATVDTENNLSVFFKNETLKNEEFFI